MAFSRFAISLSIGVLALLGLSACETIPSPILQAYDACDRQVEACYDSCLLERSLEAGQACDQRCDVEADRCFIRVTDGGLNNYPDWEKEPNFTFFGRTGYWSEDYGWVPGPHDQPYTYSRPSARNNYDRRYYDPYYDSPNDCYGYRRAPWCWGRDWYRDRWRDDRPSQPQPDPDRPTRPDPTNPTGPTDIDRENRREFGTAPTDVDEPIRARPPRIEPSPGQIRPPRVTPQRPNPPKPTVPKTPTPRADPVYRPLIPAEPSRSQPSRPVTPKPQPERRSAPTPKPRPEPAPKPRTPSRSSSEPAEQER